MTDDLKKGDKVAWNSTQGPVEGAIEKKVTAKTRIKGHVAKATTQDPQFVVKSDRTGAQAVHKPEQLKKR